jgi:site-specific DNA recombinase
MGQSVTVLSPPVGAFLINTNMKIAIYARVSTERQESEKTIDSQVSDLESLASQDKHEVIDKYLDTGFSGSRQN